MKAVTRVIIAPMKIVRAVTTAAVTISEIMSQTATHLSILVLTDILGQLLKYPKKLICIIVRSVWKRSVL